MNVIDPKLDFLQFNTEAADVLRKEAQQPWFREACNTALSQLAIQGASAEELAGVGRFLRILCNLGETTPEPVRLPVKSLDEDLDYGATKLKANQIIPHA